MTLNEVGGSVTAVETVSGDRVGPCCTCKIIWGPGSSPHAEEFWGSHFEIVPIEVSRMPKKQVFVFADLLGSIVWQTNFLFSHPSSDDMSLTGPD